MAIHDELEYAELDELKLDPTNPRLGRKNARPDLPQPKILELMKEWTLDELGVSFLQSGFWPNEALVVVEEKLYGKNALVVVEGNRRLAALLLLRAAIQGKPSSKVWEEIARDAKPKSTLFKRIPYVRADSRKDVDAFLGFRHVTGIKEWNPAEKAQYIAYLIDDCGMKYEDVRRAIGSKKPTVRQNYISYRLLLQIDETVGNVPSENIEERFSVMYLSLRTSGVQQYLNIDIHADERTARKPITKARLEQLANFAIWLFGDDDKPPLFTDSRLVDRFGTILKSKKAVEYLEDSEEPSFEVAFRKAGGDEPEVVRLVDEAANNLELALSRAHLFSKSERLKTAVKRLGAHAARLLELYPDIRESLVGEKE